MKKPPEMAPFHENMVAKFKIMKENVEEKYGRRNCVLDVEYVRAYQRPVDDEAANQSLEYDSRQLAVGPKKDRSAFSLSMMSIPGITRRNSHVGNQSSRSSVMSNDRSQNRTLPLRTNPKAYIYVHGSSTPPPLRRFWGEKSSPSFFNFS